MRKGISTLTLFATTLVIFFPICICAQLRLISTKHTYDLALPSPLSINNVEYSPLYIFGDSLYDTGMGLYDPRITAADRWPYGMTFFKHPAGRFSDGRLISDFIASLAKMSFPEPFLRKDFDNYTTAVNFAVVGAGVLFELLPNQINFNMQVGYFREMVQKLEQRVGQSKTKDVLSRAVYLINIGANDYVELAINKTVKIASPSMKRSWVDQVMGSLTANIITLYNEGGRKFAFQNMAPMGCLPVYRKLDGTCDEVANDLVLTHNARFTEVIKMLQHQLPGFKYSIYDFHKSLSARLQNGTAYGFKENKVACCGSGPFNGELTCQYEGFTVCENPNDYLWFDGAHLTEKACKQISHEFWNGSTNIIAPCNLKSLFDGSQSEDGEKIVR